MSARAAAMSRLCAEVSQDLPGTETVPLPDCFDISDAERVVAYCEHHAARNGGRDDEWDKHFMKIRHREAFTLMRVADFLQVDPLIELIVSTIAEFVRGKSSDEIARIVGSEATL